MRKNRKWLRVEEHDMPFRKVDLRKIKREPWAEVFSTAKIKGFALTQKRELVLLDDTGHYIVCPKDRFRVSICT